MEYISLTVLLLLAILGAFFKCVKEDSQGRTVHTKIGLPRPTWVGFVILFLLASSFLISVGITWRENYAAKSSARESAERERALTVRLTDLLNQSDVMQTQLKTIDKKFSNATLELEKVREGVRNVGENRALEEQLKVVDNKLKEVEKELRAAKQSPADSTWPYPKKPTSIVISGRIEAPPKKNPKILIVSLENNADSTRVINREFTLDLRPEFLDKVLDVAVIFDNGTRVQCKKMTIYGAMNDLLVFAEDKDR